MGERNTVVSAYTTYRHLQQYCSHPSICCVRVWVHAVKSNTNALVSKARKKPTMGTKRSVTKAILVEKKKKKSLQWELKGVLFYGN